VSVEEALAELRTILGKGLHPTAVSKVRKVLIKLKVDDGEGDSEITETEAEKNTRTRPSK
jgi:hypothetical protein